MKVRTKTPRPQKMLVWRMSEGSTTGEWVDPAALSEASAKAGAPRAPLEPWVSSSFDLLKGCDVSEDPKTEPGELFDDLFPAPKGPSERR